MTPGPPGRTPCPGVFRNPGAVVGSACGEPGPRGVRGSSGSCPARGRLRCGAGSRHRGHCPVPGEMPGPVKAVRVGRNRVGRPARGVRLAPLDASRRPRPSAPPPGAGPRAAGFRRPGARLPARRCDGAPGERPTLLGGRVARHRDRAEHGGTWTGGTAAPNPSRPSAGVAGTGRGTGAAARAEGLRRARPPAREPGGTLGTDR